MSPENLRLAREPLRPLSTPDSSSNNRQARPRHPQFGSQSTQRLDISAQNSSRHQSNAYGPSGGGSSLSLSLDTPTSPMAHYLASVEAVAGVSSSFIAPKSITPFESAQSSSWNLNMSYPISVPSPDPVELSEGTQQPYVSALNPCLVDVASSPRRQQPRRSVQDLGGSSLSILPRSGPSPESKPTKPRRTRTDRALEGISVSADVKGVPSKPLASTKYRASDTSSSGASSIDLSTHASPHSRSRTRGLLRAGSIASTIRSEAPPPRTIPALEEGFHAPQSSRNEGSTLVRGPKRRREAPPCPEIRLRDTSAAVGSPQDEQVLALQNGIITLPCVLKLRPLCLRPNSRTLGSIIDDRQLMREALRLNMARELGLDTNILSLATPPKHTQYGVRILKVLLPNLRDLRTPYLVFTSELLPRSFGSQKRLDIIRILRSKAAYVSACMSMPRTFSNMQYRVSYRGTSATSSPFIAPPGPSGRGWPDGNVPTEVIHNIASYLSRYDLLELRLVNHEFERKVSSLVFVSTTAAFRPQIYNGTPRDTELVDVKGKGKAKEAPNNEFDVFESWGRYMLKFCMVFDGTEEQLVNPPMKGAFDHYVEFWGDYKWPFQHYLRYELCASLENEADNFQDMSKALSNLTKVRELGLSVDSGLGFLSGPDISDRARIFHQKPTVFGPTKTDADAKFAKRQNLWEGIVSSLKTPSVFMADDTLYNNRSLDMEILGYYECESETEEEEDEVDEEDEDPPSKPKKTLFLTHVTPQDGSDRPLVFQGVEITNQAILGLVCPEVSIINVRQVHHDGPFATAPLKPNNLTIPQKEWLLETEWAQRAFLSSYSMALFDKSQTFHHVHSLAIGMISSRYLSMLQRQGIWGSLPQLETLSINVSADWRDILSSEVGVEAPDIQPSDAATHFHTLLEGCISAISGIKVLKLGYVGGGERQTGIFGRNRWILPAPLTNFSVHTEALSGRAAILKLPHVEHLTLTNCWIAPHMLKIFVRNMRTANLRTLTLDSVSLAARMGNVEATERDPLANGTTRYAKGPPRRFGDTAVGNLFQQRGAAPDPRLDGTGWAILPRPIGSWGDVINVITPGPTKDLIRYAYQVRDEAPLRYSGILERINFISCGYASLFYMRLDSPPDLGEIEHKVPARLRKRTLDLIPLMMNSRDPLLAHIIPEMKEQDLEVFDTAFPMVMGWDDESQWDNYEDGQPAGGSGRFSGHVEKLTFPEESSAEESSPNGD